MGYSDPNAVLQFYNNNTRVLDLIAAPYFMDGEYSPNAAEPNERGEFDTLGSIEEQIPYYVTGCSRDELNENHNAVNRLMVYAERHQQDRLRTGPVEVETAVPGQTYLARAEVLSGRSHLEPGILGRTRTGKLFQRANLTLRRRPDWEAASDVSIDLTATGATAPSNNGLLNVAILPTATLLGDLPARCRTRLTFGAGNSANCARVLAALRADKTIANFVHILEAESATAGAVGMSTTADTDFSPGAGNTGILYTPGANVAQNLIARWDVTSNVADQPGRFLCLLRYYEYQTTTTTPNFKLQFRTSVKIGSNYMPGPWWSDPVTTLYCTASSTIPAEAAVLELGQGPVPGVFTEGQAVVTLSYELYAQQISVIAGSVLAVDYAKLFPISESAPGRGLVGAEFYEAIGSNRVYLDSRYRQMRAYVTNGSDVVLGPANDIVEGGDIWLWPQLANQRVYFHVCRAKADASVKLGDSLATTITAVMTYRPRYINLRGTT